jgi:hypothetical protein
MQEIHILTQANAKTTKNKYKNAIPTPPTTCSPFLMGRAGSHDGQTDSHAYARTHQEFPSTDRPDEAQTTQGRHHHDWRLNSVK